MVIASSTGAAMQMNAPQLAGELAKLATLRTGQYPTALEQLWWRLFRKDLAFLVSTRAQALNLTNALPKVFDLWDMPMTRYREDAFAERFAAFGGLQYN